MQDNIVRKSSELSKYSIIDNLTKSYVFVKSKGQTNRFAIINYYENILDKIKNNNSKLNITFSNDKLTKSLSTLKESNIQDTEDLEIFTQINADLGIHQSKNRKRIEYCCS